MVNHLSSNFLRFLHSGVLAHIGRVTFGQLCLKHTSVSSRQFFFLFLCLMAVYDNSVVSVDGGDSQSTKK